MAEAPHTASPSLLLAVWLALLALLALTLGSAYLSLGAFNTWLNYGIAALKVALVALVFMHLRRSDTAVRCAAVIALLFLVVLAFLTFGDFLTRGEDPAPWRAPPGPPAPQ